MPPWVKPLGSLYSQRQFKNFARATLSRRRFTFTLRTDLGGRIEDRLYNFVVAGASAQVSRERVWPFGLGRFRIVSEQRLRRHQKSGGADAALETRVFEELTLQRMQHAGG